MARFRLKAPFEPKGDQPQAIKRLCEGLDAGVKKQVLLGVTGSGKTLTMAHCIAHYGRPTLVISHNKTLAAQLYGEFKEFFPDNAVEYFISYYDYYQPEAYIPQRDLYIEKDASINEEIEKLRLAATSALMSREDVIIVASVSCIYGLGDPSDYEAMTVKVAVGDRMERDVFLMKLADIQYERDDVDFSSGTFRVRGDVVDVNLPYEERALSVEFFGDRIERIRYVHPLSRQTLQEVDAAAVFPARHFVVPEDRIVRAVESIERELEERLKELRAQGKELEARRLEARTRYDMEMLLEVGYCAGIENYSRHLSGRRPGERPYTLIDFFPEDFLVIVDESHVTIPQLRGMYNGDRSRKETLVEHGFRLPSALDNRPMRFDEWEEAVDTVLFVSATPGPYELEQSGGRVVEQIIRPTGLVDPEVEVKPTEGQMESVLKEVKTRIERGERVLVTTLTKSMAEDLSTFLQERGIKCTYLHSEIDALDRVDILRDLRLGRFDVLVGVNLLREGIDLPEVSLVVILDADKEGFLRSETSLIQTMGRAARHVNAKVLLYADEVTDSMRRAIEETNRRRRIQMEYNRIHGISPSSVKKAVREGFKVKSGVGSKGRKAVCDVERGYYTARDLEVLEREMREAADRLDFEHAAYLRDLILELKGETSHTKRKSAARGSRLFVQKRRK